MPAVPSLALGVTSPLWLVLVAAETEHARPESRFPCRRRLGPCVISGDEWDRRRRLPFTSF